MRGRIYKNATTGETENNRIGYELRALAGEKADEAAVWYLANTTCFLMQLENGTQAKVKLGPKGQPDVLKIAATGSSFATSLSLPVSLDHIVSGTASDEEMSFAFNTDQKANPLLLFPVYDYFLRPDVEASKKGVMGKDFLVSAQIQYVNEMIQAIERREVGSLIAIQARWSNTSEFAL